MFTNTMMFAETDTRECNCDICIKSGIGIRVH